MRYISIVFSIFCLLTLVVDGYGQKGFYYGLKAGITYGTPVGPAEEGATGRPGLGPILGAFGEYNFNDKLGIQGDIYFTRKKAKFSTPVTDQAYTYERIPFSNPDTIILIETTFSGNVTGEFDNSYIEIPILLKYNFSKQLSLLAGPYFAFNIAPTNIGTATGNVGFGNLPIENEAFDESRNISDFDYGGQLGLRYDTNFGVHVDFRLTSGLKSVFKPSYTLAEDVIRNVYMTLTAGYRLQALSRKYKESVIKPNTNI